MSRSHTITGLGSASVVAALLVGATLPIASATSSASTSTTSIHLVERGGGIKVVDNPPAAKHPYEFSAGDIVVVRHNLTMPGGAAAGHLRLICIATTPSTQQCEGTANLAGGAIEFAGVSTASQTTHIAVIGGTGDYAGARGAAVSTDRDGPRDIADLRITLLS